MIKFILYGMGIVVSTSLGAMSCDALKVTLNAPEYWIEKDGDFIQCDVDEAGQPCAPESRERLLESEYVNSFPKLRKYLAKNDDRLRGFDPKQFNLLKDCLQLSYIYKNTEKLDEKKRIKDDIKVLFDNPEHSPRKLIDMVQVSRLAGLSLIEKLAVKALGKRTISRLVKEGGVEIERSRPIAVDDIYPSYDSLDEIGKDEVRHIEELESDEEIEQPSFSFIASWYSQFKNFFATKPCTDLFIRPQLSHAELAEITHSFRQRQTAFYHAIKRIKEEKERQQRKEQKQSDAEAFQSWWGKCKSMMAYLFGK